MRNLNRAYLSFETHDEFIHKEVYEVTLRVRSNEGYKLVYNATCDKFEGVFYTRSDHDVVLYEA